MDKKKLGLMVVIGILLLSLLATLILKRKTNKVNKEGFLVPCTFDTMLTTVDTYQYAYRFRSYSSLSGQRPPSGFFRTDINKMYISPSFTGGAFVYTNVLYIVKTQGAVDQVDGAGNVIVKGDGFQTIFDKSTTQTIMRQGNLYMDIRQGGTSLCIIKINNATINQRPAEFTLGSVSASTIRNTAYYGFDLGQNPVMRGSIPSTADCDIYLKDISQCYQPCAYTQQAGPQKCYSTGDGSTCSGSDTVTLDWELNPPSQPNCYGSAPASTQYSCKGTIKSCSVDSNAVNCARAQDQYRSENGLPEIPDAWKHYQNIGAYEGKSWPSSACDCQLGEWSEPVCPPCAPAGTTTTVTRTVVPAQGTGFCPETNPSSTKQVTCDSTPTCESQCVGNNDWTNSGTCQPGTQACGAGKGVQQQTQTLNSLVPNACTLANQSLIPSKTRTVPCDLVSCESQCVGNNDWTDSGPCNPSLAGCGAGNGLKQQTQTLNSLVPNACTLANQSLIPSRTRTTPCDLGSCESQCVGGSWVTPTCPPCGPAGTTVTQTRQLISQVSRACELATTKPATSQPFACVIPTCEDPPPPGTIPVSPYPFSCTDTYNIKIVYSPPNANKDVTLHAMLLLKPGATDVAGKTSTWTVTSAPNFSTGSGAPIITKWTDRVTWKFPLAQKYTINYRLSYGGKTCSFSFDITISGQTCTDRCTNLNTATNSCQKITLPSPPPRTKGTLKCTDVQCGPNQFKDCPVVYQPGNSPTNPCPPGNVYNFDSLSANKCEPSGEYCCNYSQTTGALDQGKFAAARNDTRCVDNLTQQYRLKPTSPTRCSPIFKPGVDNRCCDPRAATLPACAAYWQAVPSWKKMPINCQVAPPYQGFKDYDGYETQDIASVDQDSIIYTKGALQSMRQKFLNLKNLIM